MKHLDALRARAARIDADFEKRERRASAELSAIRYRNAIEASERLLDAPVPAYATGPCIHCLDAVPGRTK